MQSIEAIISLMVLVSISAYMLSGSLEKPGLDDSLYRYQLANDVWRVLYLRGDFKGLDVSNGASVGRVDTDLDEITSLTGHCIYLHGIQLTSCRNGEGIATVVSRIERVAFEKGNASSINLTLAVPEK